MAYGQNLSSGLQSFNSSASAPWNAQLETLPIPSGYAQNIFIGDPVCLLNGNLVTLADPALGASATAQIIGVFAGWSAQIPTALNPIDPASPGKTYWPAGTVTNNGQSAQGFYLQDPNNYYNLQADVGGVNASQVGKTAAISFVPANPGNTTTGVSTCVLNSGSIGTAATANVRIMGFITYQGNIPGIPYNNVRVLIQNHSLLQRAIGQ